ncbi:TRAP transporter large permease subunit [Ahrensia sp. R2A130]|uniref:TRAP transporter large permease n=1 Tax=Ahrensia sp. R2A130 TaxID=744979 RepID=UPI0001E0D128|nr:TRAP transporter large permease subunit [Ahrensia sp. R2A130]EFL87898.1 trap dicarboxylate transporter, dctm subunit [Ahrensia sp. R2A130]
MDIGTISLILLLGMLTLLAIGMPLGFASGFLAVMVLVLKFEPTLITDPFVHGFNFEAWKVGEGILTRDFGRGPLNVLAQRLYGITTNYVLISVPLFIFMAVLLERSGIARDMYSSLSMWMNRLRGGIAVVTAIMAIVMAAMSGIIGGEVVLLGLIALPQMLRLGYDQNLAIGTICASGSLGTMIPPSIVLIFYGLITETSIHALFQAAFVPGFILAGCYIVYILIRTRLNPSLAPLPEPTDDDLTQGQKKTLGLTLLAQIGLVACFILLARFTFVQMEWVKVEETTWFQTMRVAYIAGPIFLLSAAWLTFGVNLETSREAWAKGKGMVQPLLVVFIVLGSIYGGVTGITEAAAMGSIAVLVLIVLRGEFSFTLLREASMRTFKSTGTIIWVTLGATALAGAYTIAGGPTYVANLIVGYELPTMGVLLVMMVIFLFLGAFMDWTGIVLLVMPVFLPIVLKLPMDEIGLFGGLDSRTAVQVWFGILFCVNMQVSFLSPPFGPAAFYLKSVAPPHITLPDIFRGFLPFIAIQLCILTLILLVPSITTLFLN